MKAAGGNILKLILSMNALLLFIPLALYLEHFRPQAHTLIFFSACLGVIPLAGWMGKATEQVADRAGEGIGGLLNATFGNAAELIIAIVALQAGYLDVVKASLTGSIIGNILLMLGASFLAGECATKFRIQCHYGLGPGPNAFADFGGHHHPGPVSFCCGHRRLWSTKPPSAWPWPSSS
jgi:Ca2+:H+ antiporter